MAPCDSDTAIESFLDLERRFEAFVRAIPIAKEHNRVHSPILASILLDSCSLLETVLKSSMDNIRYNAIKDIARLRGMRYSSSPPFLNIGELRKVFRSDAFYSKPVWYLPRGESSFPWYRWRQASGNPKWWDAYNAVKHSRFQNASQATLLTTLHALKGLFLAIVQSLDFRVRLVDRGHIRCSHWSIGVGDLRARMVSWEPIGANWATPIIARTELFGYRFLSLRFPTSKTDPAAFLQ